MSREASLRLLIVPSAISRAGTIPSGAFCAMQLSRQTESYSVTLPTLAPDGSPMANRTNDDAWLSSPLAAWMQQQRSILTAMARGGSLDWRLATQDFRRLSKVDHLGQAATVETVTEIWRRMGEEKLP